MTQFEHLRRTASERIGATARAAWQWYRSQPRLTRGALAAAVALGAIGIYRYLTAERKGD